MHPATFLNIETMRTAEYVVSLSRYVVPLRLTLLRLELALLPFDP